MSFLPPSPQDEIAVLLKALGPLAASSPGGTAAVEEFLKSGADLGPIKELLQAAGLVVISADGVVSEPSKAATAATGTKSDLSDPLITVPIQVVKSLESALVKQAAAYQEKLAAAGGPPAIGTQCKRKNCKMRYESEESNTLACKFCAGEPVFHEGYKYWSCCDKKKTLDFEEFLDLPGCSEAPSCLWYEDESDGTIEKPVRLDHFESGRDFVVSFFTKCPEPGQTEIKVNANTLSVSTVYERNCTFTKSFKLKGTIVPDKCTAKLMSAKIDVKLVKTSGERWETLE